MGMVCGCDNKKPHPKENAGPKFEGGMYFSDINDSQTLDTKRLRKQQKIKKTIGFMHHSNPEFRRQLANKFRSHERYKKALKQIKRRPELAPHFLLNGKNADGVFAGEQSFERLAVGQAPRSSSVRDDQEQRESLMSPSLIDQIDFNQLGKAEASLQLPSQNQDGRQRAFSESSICDRSSQYLRYTFDSMDLQRSSDNDQLRNFKPSYSNKNVSKIALTFDDFNNVWGRKDRRDDHARTEQRPVVINVPNYFFKGRVLWTKQEYLSVQKIQMQYKVHQFKRKIRQLIKRRRELLFHKKQLKKMMKKQLSQSKSKPEPKGGDKDAQEPKQEDKDDKKEAEQKEPSKASPAQPAAAEPTAKSDDEVSIKSSELYQESQAGVNV